MATDSDQPRVEVLLSDPDHYRRVYAADGVPCPVEGCPISAQEHHRLAYGWLSELRALRAAALNKAGHDA